MERYVAGRAVLGESSKRVRPWRQDVVAAAIEAQREVATTTLERWVPLECPVHVVAEFYLPRPKGHPKARRTVPLSAPDLDKLSRSTLDALTTAGVYRDDALVVGLTVRKRYVVQNPALGMAWEMYGPGAVVTVFTVDPQSTWGDVPLAHLYAATRPSFGVHPSLTGCVVEGVDVASLPGDVRRVTADMPRSDRSAAVRRVRRELDRRAAHPDARGAHIPVTLVVDAQLVSCWDGQPAGTFTAEVAAIARNGAACHIHVAIVLRRLADTGGHIGGPCPGTPGDICEAEAPMRHVASR